MGRIANAPYWGGYPWESLRNSQEFFVVTLDVVPAGWGQVISSVGQNIYVPPPARAQFMFSRNGNSVYSPWMAVSLSPIVFPKPRVSNNVVSDLLVHAEPGVSFTVSTINL